jgi:hypothetical protein
MDGPDLVAVANRLEPEFQILAQDVTEIRLAAGDELPGDAQLKQPISAEPMLQWFEYEHLPPHLQEASAPFCMLAHRIVRDFPRNPERTVTLRKLLESKDAGVRAVLSKP